MLDSTFPSPLNGSSDVTASNIIGNVVLAAGIAAWLFAAYVVLQGGQISTWTDRNVDPSIE